jgi:hypothetical protein
LRASESHRSRNPGEEAPDPRAEQAAIRTHAMLNNKQPTFWFGCFLCSKHAGLSILKTDLEQKQNERGKTL